MPQASRSTIVYDASCGPCTSFKRLVAFLDPRRQIEFVPLAEADREGMLDEVSQSMRWSSFHLVAAGVPVRSGAQAVPGLVRLLPSGSVVSGLMVMAPGGPRIVSWLYSTLSRLHNSCGR